MLIAATSGRALAACARRAGFVPLVADLFDDLDTRALAGASLRVPGGLARGFAPGALAAALDRLAAGRRPEGLVVGSGFEDRPGLLGALGARHGLIGNAPATVATAKDPPGFAALCGGLGIPHPEIRLEGGREAPRSGDWLRKRRGGSGGAHVAPARSPAHRGFYLQRRAEGAAVSALFLADGARCLILGFSRQWADPAPGRPFRYGGAVRPASVTDAQADAMGRAVARLAPALGLVGLNSADFLLRPDGMDLLEINPRPGATLDIFADTQGRLFHMHVDACRGRLPGRPPAFAGSNAACVAYAPRALDLPAGFCWPDWAADRQAPGTPVAKGAPLCTVLAAAGDAEEAAGLARARAASILRLAGAAP